MSPHRHLLGSGIELITYQPCRDIHRLVQSPDRCGSGIIRRVLDLRGFLSAFGTSAYRFALWPTSAGLARSASDQPAGRE